MENRYKLIGGSLVGAIAIHVAFVACGHSLGVKGDVDGGTEAGLLDALVDQVSSLLDGTTKDARADVDGGVEGGGGGTCGCTTVSGSVQSVPASENPAQLVRGNVPGLSSAGTIVATGPLVLTDATAVPQNPGSTAGATLVIQPTAATCTALSVQADTLPGYVTGIMMGGDINYAVHGGRFLIPAGQMLCAFTPFPAGVNNGYSAELQWAGFAPYQ